MPPNKELKLTKPGTIGASQLNSSVGRTDVERAMTEGGACRSLLALSGEYNPVGRERFAMATDALWQTAVGASFALALPMFLVGLVAPALWEPLIASWPFAIAGGATLVVPLVAAYARATTAYSIDINGVRAQRGWPLPGWRLSSTRIVEVRLVRGMFRWTLELGLAGGREKHLTVPERVGQLLQQRLSEEPRGRPTKS
jgi:hypothetical protein